MSQPHDTHASHAGATIPDEHGGSHAVVGEHGSAADHGGGHGHDDHAHASEGLGPIDWTMWIVGLVGVGVGLVVTGALVFSTGFVFGA